MKSIKRDRRAAPALLCACVVVAAVYLIAARQAREATHAAGQRQLQIIALDLESVLEKFETLPFALSYQPEAVRVLTHPADAAAVASLNLTLRAIQRQSKVAAIYLMDRRGDTLAASNWDQPYRENFMGKNFGFRPYFKEGLQGRAGRFYGIGNSTNEPGYFLTQPVYADNLKRGSAAPIGVMAIKISLDEFERNWRSSEEPLALADRNGVIFLSNRAQWKYHSLGRLPPERQRELIATLQYGGMTILPLAGGIGDNVSHPVGRVGWRLMLFPSERRIMRSASLAAVAAALLLAIAGLSLWAQYQRRRRLEERQLSRDALQRAAEDLDRIITQRTQELLDANRNLETRYAKLQDTEQMLRSTQNELVQAGKLAMLGQMAAGVTHELNQPLAAIRAFADNAGTFLARGQPERAAENLNHIAQASARMGAIIAQLKGFARKSGQAVAPVDLAAAIQASVFLLQGEFRRHDVALEIAVEAPAQVVGDAGRTEQVLINLLRNALDAVDAVAPPAPRKVRVVLSREGDHAVIRIRDTGAGIAEQVAQHLFEPFFTTKTSEQGLGLGLAISSSIVQAMQGQLSAGNHAEGGAEFVVRLPLLKNGE
jgi:two-component system C4-dicarboxylate transport sensor histidine kinase DctB